MNLLLKKIFLNLTKKEVVVKNKLKNNLYSSAIRGRDRTKYYY